MKRPVKIRQFISSDMKEIEEIEKTSIRYVTPLSLLSLYYEIVPEYFLVAEVGGKVVGYIVANLRRTRNGSKEGHILSIAVDPTFRNNGIGTKLVNQVVNVFRNKRVEKLSLEVNVNNMVGRQFYLSIGFEEACILKHYYRITGVAEDAVLMVKSTN